MILEMIIDISVLRGMKYHHANLKKKVITPSGPGTQFVT